MAARRRLGALSNDHRIKRRSDCSLNPLSDTLQGMQSDLSARHARFEREDALLKGVLQICLDEADHEASMTEIDARHRADMAEMEAQHQLKLAEMEAEHQLKMAEIDAEHEAKMAQMTREDEFRELRFLKRMTWMLLAMGWIAIGVGAGLPFLLLAMQRGIGNGLSALMLIILGAGLLRVSRLTREDAHALAVRLRGDCPTTTAGPRQIGSRKSAELPEPT